MHYSKHPVVLGVRSLAISSERRSKGDKAGTARLQRRNSRSKQTDGTSHIHKEKA
jgi:hypothetical protein